MYPLDKFIICGTDTNCGKSTAVIFLYHYLCMNGNSIPLVIKPVQTGKDKDTSFYERYNICFDNILNFYSFKKETSPHLASLAENVVIDLCSLENISRLLIQYEERPVIFEMVGGIMAPLTQDYFVVDFMKNLQIPVILVTSNQIGAINHLLMSIEVLIRYHIPLAGIILNEKDPNGYSSNELKPFISHHLIGMIPYLKDYTQTLRSNHLVDELLLKWRMTNDK